MRIDNKLVAGVFGTLGLASMGYNSHILYSASVSEVGLALNGQAVAASLGIAFGAILCITTGYRLGMEMSGHGRQLDFNIG